jgi:hypothetical protein
MRDQKINWDKLTSAYDFDCLVTTYVFLSGLLNVDLIKEIDRKDIFWTTWHEDNKPDRVIRTIFKSPVQEADKQKKSLDLKFAEKVESLLKSEKPIKVVLFINFDDSPPEWNQKGEHLQVITATEIQKSIDANLWWPLFQAYSIGSMRFVDKEDTVFLKAFAESLEPAVERLSIKEVLNVISWVEEIAFYRPHEVLAFCKAIYGSHKEEQEVQHALFGPTKIDRDDSLEKIQSLLKSVAANENYFKESLELLLRISTNLDVKHLRDFLSEPVKQITGYYYGRDFVARDNNYRYEPKFNQMTLDVVERMLQNEKDIQLLTRCIAVIPNLLKMRVESTKFVKSKDAISITEYRLPIDDASLKEVRERALSLLFNTFDQSTESVIRYRCLAELQNSFQYMSLSADLMDDFSKILDFLENQSTGEDVYVQNSISEMLRRLSGSSDQKLIARIDAIQARLDRNSQLAFYRLLFGRHGFDPQPEYVEGQVKRCVEKYQPKDLILLLDEFYKIKESQTTGDRSFFRSLGYKNPDFGCEMIRIVSDDSKLRKNISLGLVRVLGYILVGVRGSDQSAWRECVDTLRRQGDNRAMTIALTAFHLHQNQEFTADDLGMIRDMIPDADEEIRILIANTLWFFDKYSDFDSLLAAYEQLSQNMTTELSAQILQGLARGVHEENFAEKWAEETRRASLKRILSPVFDFPLIDWSAMNGYYLELLLSVLWRYSTEDILAFFRRRLDPERSRIEGYSPLPYQLHDLFQNVSDERQNDFVSRVLQWDTNKYPAYRLAQLLGLALSQEIKELALATLKKTIETGDKSHLILIAKLLNDIPLSDKFYDLAMQIADRSGGDSEVINQLWASFISTTGGSRSIGEQFPSHLIHKKLIAEFRVKFAASEQPNKLLDHWESEIEDHIKRDEEEDAER